MTNLTQNETILGFHHVWVPASQPDRPTLLLLHGTGGDEYDLIGLGQMIAPGAALLSPRGQVTEGTMNRFFRRLAEGVFDVEDLKLRTADLAEFVDRASKQYCFDAARVVAAGFSNGANIAASLMLLYPAALQAAILLAPMVPLTPDASPNLAGKRLFIGAGETDPIAPPSHADALAQMFAGYGAGVTIFKHPSGHTVTRGEIEAAASWLENIG